MNKKEISKRYLISGSVLFFAGAAVIFILCLVLNGKSQHPFTVSQLVLAAVLSGMLALGSYTGFVLAGLKVGKAEALGKKTIIAVCVFFPITLALLTVFGIIMIIPAFIKATVTLLKND